MLEITVIDLVQAEDRDALIEKETSILINKDSIRTVNKLKGRSCITLIDGKRLYAKESYEEIKKCLQVKTLMQT